MSSMAALAPAALSRASSSNCAVKAASHCAAGSIQQSKPRLSTRARPTRLGFTTRVGAAPSRAVSKDKESFDACVPNLEGDGNLSVTVDGTSDPKLTVISIQATNRPGILQLLKSTLEDLGLNVERTEVDMENDLTSDTFYVTGDDNKRVDDPYDLANIEQVITVVLNAHFLKSSGAPRPVDNDKERSTSGPDGTKPRQKDLLYSLMDNYIKNDVLSVQNSIVNHVEYTLGRSRYRFDDFEAYQATSLSVRDRLIESWNDTQQYFREQDPKRVYYLSMEFLMGRSLTNSLYNLEVQGTFSEGLRQLGYNMEDLVEKERDAALGNGGLGRLAACFLDSMASENLPAWGYGIRYQYGMFRQEMHDGFQHENPDYWYVFLSRKILLALYCVVRVDSDGF